MLIDKPAGLTSHDVVQQVRRRLGTRAVGHTGTLDPFATGLLVVLVGRATRLAQFLEGESKTYLATARLGIKTTTDDLTGRALGTSELAVEIPEPLVRKTLRKFEGAQLQRPPQYSAKRVGGERSYRKARRGEAVELPNVSVTVHRIELVQYHPPHVSFRALVSTGTYIRAMARDLGDRLGVGAHLTSLRREAIGSLRVEDAVASQLVDTGSLISVRTLLGHLPSVELDEPGRIAVAHGRAVVDDGEAGKRGGGEDVALFRGGDLVAIARAEDGWLRPRVVLESP